MTSKNGMMRHSVEAMQIGDFIRALPLEVPEDHTVWDTPFQKHDMSSIDALEIRRFQRILIEEWDGNTFRAWVRIQ